MSGASEPNERLRAILLFSLAFVLFTFLDAAAKWLARDYATPQIVWARYAGHFLLAILWFLPRYGGAVWRSANVRLQVLRSLFLFAATASNFFALRYLQLAETSAIAFSVPLLVAALSVPLLGEHVGLRRWGAIVVGFIGVLIIARPGAGAMHWAVSFSFAMAGFAALYQITTRKLAGQDPPQTTLVYSALVGTVLATPLLPFVWSPVVGWLPWALMALMGVCGCVGHYLLIVAHRHAPAPILAPFVYPQILYMTLSGWLIFGDVPDCWVLVGAAVVIASGLFLWYRELVLGKRYRGTGVPPVR